MLIGLLVRFGLGAIIPWLLPGLIAVLLGGGGLAAWGFNLTDWKTAILLVIALGMIAQLATVQSPWAKVAITAVVAITCYIKGYIDGTLEVEQRIQAAVTTIRTEVATASKHEITRQEAANLLAREQAEVEKTVLTGERDRLRAELKAIKEEAPNDPTANQPALGPDAVERVNRLRHERRPAGPNRVGGKAPDPTRPKLDDKAVPKAKANPGGNVVPSPN